MKHNEQEIKAMVKKAYSAATPMCLSPYSPTAKN